MIARRLAVALIPLVLALAVPAQAGAAFGFLGTWGSFGSLDGQFSGPAGLDVDPATGDVYVAECNGSRVQRFDANGAFLRKWGSPGTGNGQFTCARDVAVDATGVYVVDAGNNRVQKFTTAGAYVSQFNAADSGRAFDQPNGVATDGTNVYVSDTSSSDLLGQGKERVQRFNTSGVFQAQVGAAGSGGANTGEYNKMGGVAVGSSGIFVSDYTNHRVVRFDPLTYAGKEVWGSLGSGDGQFREFQGGVDVDASGNVWVADQYGDRVQRFTPAGAFLGTWGTTGTGDLNMNRPLDVAAGPSGALYVADTSNERIVKYGEGGTVAPTVVTGDAADVTPGGARLTGTVNPQGTSTSYRFEYGPTTSYGSTTAVTDAGAGTSAVAASATLTGLGTQTTYHYRLVALRGGSVVAVGADRTFTTPPSPGGATGCARQGHTIGVVAVCADTITSTGTGTWRASGNVTLNGGVVVDGALDLNDGLQLITSSAGTSIGVNRGGVVNWGTGRLQIDTRATTDPVSGRTGLATVTVFDFTRIVQASFGGLTMGFFGTSNEYLDSRDGGGLILSAKPNFDLGAFINVQPVGSFALGIHADAPSEFRLLGGSLGWNGINLPGGWKIGLLKLEYQADTSTWAFTGGAEITGVGSLQVSGGVAGGRLDALGVRIRAASGVPLGQTGIILDTLSGSLKGLAGGEDNPLIAALSVGGGWTPTGAPRPFNWILHIKDVGLTIDASGSGTLSGGVAVLDGEGRLASGTISFTIGIDPFVASGAMTVNLRAVLVSLAFNAQAAMNREHFTASGTVSGRLVGVNVGSASGIISDIGAGATVRVCFISCWWVGYGLKWADVSSFPPDLTSIGGDIERYRTISASSTRARAAAAERRFTVERNRPLLTVTARAQDARTKFELIGPNGVRYRLGGKRRDLYSEVYDGGKVSALVVYEPRAGIWRLREIDAPKARVKVEQVAAIGRLRPRTLRPTGTAKRPLSRRKVKTVLATWGSSRMPKGTVVDVYVASTRQGQGARIKRGLRTSGRYRIPVKALKHKTNWVSIVARAEGIAFQRATYRVPVRLK